MSDNYKYIFVPFSDLKNNKRDPLVITAVILWSIVVEMFEIRAPWGSDETTIVTGVLTGTLGFLLALNLDKNLTRNKSGIALFEAYVGNIEALAWAVHTIEKDCDSMSKAEIYEILKILPNTLKHVFRKDFDYGLLKTTENLKREMKKFDGDANSPVETLLFLLANKLHKIGNTFLILDRKWDGLFSPYGSIASLQNYETPIIFDFVLTSALILFCTFLPLSYSQFTYWNVLISFLIMYFFVGLNTAGQMVQNPFVSLPKNVTIYPTASAISKGSKDVIERIQTYCEKTANGNLSTDSSLYIW